MLRPCCSALAVAVTALVASAVATAQVPDSTRQPLRFLGWASGDTYSEVGANLVLCRRPTAIDFPGWLVPFSVNRRGDYVLPPAHRALLRQTQTCQVSDSVSLLLVRDTVVAINYHRHFNPYEQMFDDIIREVVMQWGQPDSVREGGIYTGIPCPGRANPSFVVYFHLGRGHSVQAIANCERLVDEDQIPTERANLIVFALDSNAVRELRRRPVRRR